MSKPEVTEDNIFLAVLAMDTYHRGVNSGLKNLGNSGQIGTATIERYSEDGEGSLDDDIGFVAFEYAWKGKNVYAYRGVRRHINWNRFAPDLTEYRAHLV